MKCQNQNHNNNADLFCFNENCKEFRVYCLQCNQEGMHYGHQKSSKLFPDVENEFILLQTQYEEIMQFVINMMNLINEKFNRFIQEIKIVSDIKILNNQDWNKVICNLIKFRDSKERKQLEQIVSNNTTNLIESLNDLNKVLQLDCFTNIQSNSNSSLDELPIKNFKYEIIQESCFYDDKCYSFTFNKDQSQLMVGYFNNKIKVYNFENGNVNMFQELNDHENSVFCLNFMKKSNKLISGSADESIKIWKQNNDMKWECEEQLSGNKSSIICLTINQNEDQIICGGYSSFLNFWKCQSNQWQCIQTLNIENGSIKSISYNISESCLIFCNSQKQIFICKRFCDQWEIIQNINIDESGYRLCFINENTFAFQRCCKDVLDIYELNNQEIKHKKIIVENGNSRICNDWFPQSFIPHRQLLINKNGCCINFIRINGKNNLQTISHIQFQSHDVWGTISYDGQYLVTWDAESKQIQIRKYQEI